MWGLLGPVTFQTRRGRVTFFAGFVTLPLTAWSVWSLLKAAEPAPPPAPARTEVQALERRL